MALKLDDLLTKKKEPVQILDLSRSTANSREEVKKLTEKVPEFKIKMEKVKIEDVKSYDRKYNFKATKKELRQRRYSFINPVPSEMKSLRLNDLCSVGIQWKMLTSLRPRSKLDEEYYSKMIELGKLELATREKEKKTPLVLFIRKSKNRAGVVETKIIPCRECGEEFCSSETCSHFAYELFERVNITMAAGLAARNSVGNEKRKKRWKKKSVPKKVTRLKKKAKRKIGSEAAAGGKKTLRKAPTVQRVEANKPLLAASVNKRSENRKGSYNLKSKSKHEKLDSLAARSTNPKKLLSKFRTQRKTLTVKGVQERSEY